MGNSSVTIPEVRVPLLAGNVAHIRVLMDGAYFKMYVNERRLYNIPELAFKRDSVIRILTGGAESAGDEVYLTSIAWPRARPMCCMTRSRPRGAG